MAPVSQASPRPASDAQACDWELRQLKLDEVLRNTQALRDACEADPGLWNLVRAEQEWALYGDACDPLSPVAPERALKALERDIYLEVWGSALSAIAAGGRTLVVGGGTGRFARAMAQRGLRVELIDASPEAARRARCHLGESVPVTTGDASRPGAIERAAYDLVLAVEVVCYAADPLAFLRQLHFAVRPGGTVLFSVEARPGALLGDRDLASPEAFDAVVERGAITLPGLKHVHYYTREEAHELAARAGFSATRVDGVCYVPDGPLNAFIDATRLEDASFAAQIAAIERQCRTHPALRELPRAWAVAAVRREDP